MEIVRVKLSDLKHDDKNARKHGKRNIDEVKRSIAAFGQHRPFVVQRGTNRVIVGNGMLDAMLELGITEGDAYFVDDDDETSIRRALADNRTGELAEWDMSQLKDLFQEMGPEPDVPGWNIEEVSDLFDWHDATQQPLNVVEDVPPAAREESIARRGEVWRLGKHRVMCGDSTSIDDMGTLMAGSEADMAFTDPPWNVNYGGCSKDNPQKYKVRKILNDSMPTEKFRAFLESAFFALKHSIVRGGIVYIVMSAQEWGNLMDTMTTLGFHWSSTIIWHKDTLVLSRKDYHTQYEPIWYGWEDSAARVCPLKDRTQSDVWDIPRPKKSEEHPTMKPIALVARAIENSSERGARVLDLFGGSGSTLIACEQTGRICYMMELAPNYVDVIIRRWQNLTGKRAINDKTGALFPE